MERLEGELRTLRSQCGQWGEEGEGGEGEERGDRDRDSGVQTPRQFHIPPITLPVSSTPFFRLLMCKGFANTRSDFYISALCLNLGKVGMINKKSSALGSSL